MNLPDIALQLNSDFIEVTLPNHSEIKSLKEKLGRVSKSRFYRRTRTSKKHKEIFRIEIQKDLYEVEFIATIYKRACKDFLTWILRINAPTKELLQLIIPILKDTEYRIHHSEFGYDFSTEEWKALYDYLRASTKLKWEGKRMPPQNPIQDHVRAQPVEPDYVSDDGFRSFYWGRPNRTFKKGAKLYEKTMSLVRFEVSLHKSFYIHPKFNIKGLEDLLTMDADLPLYYVCFTDRTLDTWIRSKLVGKRFFDHAGKGALLTQ